MRHLRCIFLALLISGPWFTAPGQDLPASDTAMKALNIYLECADCDLDYFKTNFKVVNYVVHRQMADVHVLVTDMATASGGREYSIKTIGSDKFGSRKDTLVCNVPLNASVDLMRSTLLANVQLSLVPYLLKSPVRDRMYLLIDDMDWGLQNLEEEDPWKNWMIRVSGMGMVNNAQFIKRYSLEGSFYVSKITPQIKFESSNSYGFNHTRHIFTETIFDTVCFEGIQDPPPTEVLYPAIGFRPSFSPVPICYDTVYDTAFVQEEMMSRNLLVKSLGNHAGIGGVLLLQRSKYSNLKAQVIAGPAVEVNVYSYEDATDKQFRILYSPQIVYTLTYAPTFDGEEEFRNYKHELYVLYMLRKDWGEVNASIYGSQYLDRPQNFSVGANASISRNLSRSLSMFASGGISYRQDQIYLPSDDPSRMEVIGGYREISSNYNYNLRVGITISLGSIYNNTVNPRFGD